MAVHSMARSRGHGTTLLNHAEQWLVGQGVKYLQVKTVGAHEQEPRVRGNAGVLSGQRLQAPRVTTRSSIAACGGVDWTIVERRRSALSGSTMSKSPSKPRMRLIVVVRCSTDPWQRTATWQERCTRARGAGHQTLGASRVVCPVARRLPHRNLFARRSLKTALLVNWQAERLRLIPGALNAAAKPEEMDLPSCVCIVLPTTC